MLSVLGNDPYSPCLQMTGERMAGQALEETVRAEYGVALLSDKSCNRRDAAPADS